MQHEIRAEINRANAQHSTGPRSLEGKQRSAMNACKHNLTGQNLILQPDETEAYRALTGALRSDLQPATELERQLVQKLIDAHFRLNRLACVENNIFNVSLIENITGTPQDDRIEMIVAQTRAWIQQSPSFDVLGRYESRLARQLLRYALELERLQTARMRPEPGQKASQVTDKRRDTLELASFGKNVPEQVMSAGPAPLSP
jgi:hypothetical protein